MNDGVITDSTQAAWLIVTGVSVVLTIFGLFMAAISGYKFALASEAKNKERLLKFRRQLIISLTITAVGLSGLFLSVKYIILD